MAKKDKETKTKPAATTASDSGSSDIFKNIFGIPQDDAAHSIFSDSNPFRRKPDTILKPIQQIDSEEGAVSEVDVAQKKNKRKKDQKESFDSVSVEEGSVPLSETKKSKKTKKVKNTDLKYDSEKEDDQKSLKLSKKGTLNAPNLNLTLKTDDEGKEKPKKRKRDELEAGYEVQHYGAAGELESAATKHVGEKRKTLDNPAEMLLSKEGFDDEFKLLRTVFVGNLPLKVKKKALLKEFSKFGEVESVRIRSVPLMDTKTPRKGAIMKKQINDSVDNVHAYIVFKTEECAQASLAHNMAMFDGNHLRVDRACPPRKKMKEDNVVSPLYDHKRTVFVGNLPFDVKDEELYKLFCGIKQLESSIEAVRVIRHSDTSIGKGIAYVLFKTREAADLVVKKRKLQLRDRELRLYHAKSESSTPLKRKITSPDASSSYKKMSNTVTYTDTSYQGVRATKSGVQKKFRPTKPVEAAANYNSKPQFGENKKVRQTKRPAVAARKMGMKSSSKRKMESRTPEKSFRSNKKVKKLR